MKNLFTKIVMVMTMTMLYGSPTCSQTVSFKVLNTEKSSSSNVTVELMVYGKSKKTIDNDAQCAALKTVLFEGCPNTPYAKALMEDGEITSREKYPQYFDNLYSIRYADFISSCEAISAFKKGDKNKGTKYRVDVKVLNLRKDIEKNNIKRKVGL